MSYIDTFDHEYLGSLGYLPIYHPLVPVENDPWGGCDFSCSPENLVLGGGGGERPGLVVHRLEAAVATFLRAQIDIPFEQALGSGGMDWLEEAAWTPRERILEYCGWTLGDSAKLIQMARSGFLATPLKEDETLENWLLASLGEFVYFSLPDLNPVPATILSALESVPVCPIMGNVLCPPPGYPPRGGRVVVGGELRWGCQRWDLDPRRGRS